MSSPNGEELKAAHLEAVLSQVDPAALMVFPVHDKKQGWSTVPNLSDTGEQQ